MSTFSNLKPINVALPQGFGYIGLIATGSLLLNVYQSIAVGRARKASGITYPRMYATEEEVKTSTQAKIYNCVQRSHQNLLEQLPAFWITLFIGGLKFPRTVVGLGVTFLIGRVLYHAGYSSGEPAARMKGGALSSPALLALIITAGISSFTFLQETGFEI